MVVCSGVESQVSWWSKTIFYVLQSNLSSKWSNSNLNIVSIELTYSFDAIMFNWRTFLLVGSWKMAKIVGCDNQSGKLLHRNLQHSQENKYKN